MIITTSICANYLPKAMVLAESVKKNHPNAKFLVSLAEREVTHEAKSFEFFDEVVLAKDLGFKDFDRFIFKHSIVEASTAVKGQLFRYMLNAFPNEDKFVYLDPDIVVFSELIELDKALDEHDIVLTPHLLVPGNIEMEISCLQHGTYNLGFLAVRRSIESEAFVNWWSERLEQYCYDDIPRGIFTDQRWIDLAPSFFDVFILKHHGYNVATWSLMTTRIEKKDGIIYTDGVPLRFFHFSGFDSGTFHKMLDLWVGDKTNPMVEWGTIYNEWQLRYGQMTLGKSAWSYDTFMSGEKVDRKTRVIYRDILSQSLTLNPFSLSNRVIRRLGQRKGHTAYKLKKAIRHPVKALKVLAEMVEQMFIR